MSLGTTKAITGKYTPSKAVKIKVVYKSSQPGVVAVDKAGMLTAKAVGTAKITVKAGKKSKRYTIRVQ